MATLAASPPASPSWPKHRPRAWAMRCERYCCAALSSFPLAFVYGLTTWAVYVEASVGFRGSKNAWIGMFTSLLGIFLYVCLNVSYTVAVFTDPGSTLAPNKNRSQRHEYSALPVTELPEYTAFTVSSTGGSRFCKKCQMPKPDRAHHCSTCKRCVLKMDHHCPWLATCVGLHNYKAFLLFLIYTCLFCWIDFAVAFGWTWTELFSELSDVEAVMPVNVIMLAILGGIIGLVLTGFTIWHLSLAVRGMTTIECLEKTRYVSPLRRALDHHRYKHLLGSDQNHHDHELGHGPEGLGHRLQGYGHQILDAHANAIPGVTRPEEGEESMSQSTYSGSGVPLENFTPAQQALSRSYADLERQRENERYQQYLNEEDSEKMPSAFNLGWRRNLLHLFGDQPLLWPVPACNTTGDGWHWEVSQKFLEARDSIKQRREQDQIEQQKYYRDLYQRNMSNGQDWLGNPRAGVATGAMPATPPMAVDPERPATGVSMKTLPPMSPRPRPGDSDYEDEQEDHHLLGPDTNSVPDGRNAQHHRRRSDGKVVPQRYRPGSSGRRGYDDWREWD